MGAAGVFLCVLGGTLIVGVVIEWFERRAEREQATYERASRERLLRELGRHK